MWAGESCQISTFSPGLIKSFLSDRMLRRMKHESLGLMFSFMMDPVWFGSFFPSLFFLPLCVSGCVCLHVWTQCTVCTSGVWLRVCVCEREWDRQFEVWLIIVSEVIIIIVAGWWKWIADCVAFARWLYHLSLSSLQPRCNVFGNLIMLLRMLFRHSVHHSVH